MIPKPTDPTPTDLEPTGGRRWAFFLTPIARVGIATLAAVCITVLTGCRGSSAPAPEAALPRAAPASTAPPTIRVRLTAPKTTAKIGTTGAYRIEVDGRRVAASDELMALTEATRRSNGWRIASETFQGRQLAVIPVDGAQVRTDKCVYRGSLVLRAAGKTRFILVNHVDLENYLAGVLGKELYPHWHPQTYRALAVAARTFAMYRMSVAEAGAAYDLTDTQSAQVYGGLSGETAKSRAAVRSTHGAVLGWGARGEEEIFPAHYSACCGGRVRGAQVLRGDRLIPPLRGGQVCHDCSPCPKYTWKPVVIPKRTIYSAVIAGYPAARAIRTLTKLSVAEADRFGRPIRVELVGPRGKSVRLRASELRSALLCAGVRAAGKLYSPNCKFRDRGPSIEFHDGRGFGHAVGLCQWGAQAKAKRGWTGQKILGFYYPGARIIAAY